jgi:two-component system, cell cycle sensor histidine kinase and response regulator CckA
VGSSFHVYLPIIERIDDQRVLEEESETPSLGSETVLPVDDDEVVLRATEGLLTEFGYTVEAFTNSIEAFRTYASDPNRFDIVVTDTTMTGMTGFDLSKKIIALNPVQLIVLCSGFSESINRDKALAIGIEEYFEKPIITWEIAKVIRSVIDKRKQPN